MQNSKNETRGNSSCSTLNLAEGPRVSKLTKAMMQIKKEPKGIKSAKCSPRQSRNCGFAQPPMMPRLSHQIFTERLINMLNTDRESHVRNNICNTRSDSQLSCEAGILTTDMNQPLLKVKQTKLVVFPPKRCSNNINVQTPTDGPETDFDGIDESNEIDFDHQRYQGL